MVGTGAHVEIGRYDRAIPALQTALKLQAKEPKPSWEKFTFCSARDISATKIEAAIASYLTAIELNPADEEILLRTGQNLSDGGDPAAAEQEFAAGIQKLGGRTNYPYWDLQIGLGRARELRGKFGMSFAVGPISRRLALVGLEQKRCMPIVRPA